MKLSAADAIRPALRLLVNRAESDAAADEVVRRMEDSCRRFLSLSVEALPALPRQDDEFNASAPRVWEAPHSAFGHATLWMARSVGEALSARIDNTESRGQERTQLPRNQHHACSIL